MLPIRAFSENAAGGGNFRFSDRTELMASAALFLSSVAIDRQDLCVEKIAVFPLLTAAVFFSAAPGKSRQ
jgi:hypothetical protein